MIAQCLSEFLQYWEKEFVIVHDDGLVTEVADAVLKTAFHGEGTRVSLTHHSALFDTVQTVFALRWFAHSSVLAIASLHHGRASSCSTQRSKLNGREMEGLSSPSPLSAHALTGIQ
jgi:hypothetical protein